MIRQKCQTENREGARFCGRCGQSINAGLACPRCDGANPAGNDCCFECYRRPGASAASQESLSTPGPQSAPSTPEPTSFAGGRCQVNRLPGAGGKKRACLADDTLPGGDVAFALVKTEGLWEKGKVCIQREARAMGRVCDPANIVTIHDAGEREGQPCLVLPALPGGDVEELIGNRVEESRKEVKVLAPH